MIKTIKGLFAAVKQRAQAHSFVDRSEVLFRVMDLTFKYGLWVTVTISNVLIIYLTLIKG